MLITAGCQAYNSIKDAVCVKELCLTAFSSSTAVINITALKGSPLDIVSLRRELKIQTCPHIFEEIF